MIANKNPMLISGSKGGGGSKTPTEDKDTLKSNAMLYILDLLGEGQIGGLIDGARSILLDGTALMAPVGASSPSGSYDANGNAFNFANVAWEANTGNQSQGVIGGFSDIETPYGVNRQVKKGIPQYFTIINENADSVRIVMFVPALIKTDVEDGDIHGSDVAFNFSVSTEGGAYVSLGDFTISGKCRSKYQRSYLFDLPSPGIASTWTIRVTRITDDAPTANIQNDIFIDNYAEIVSTKLNYPNSAMVGFKFDATEVSTIPRRSYLVRGLYVKVPSNYDANTRTYSGIWDGTFKVAVTDNPAWIMNDLLTNKRYGLGNYITQAQVNTSKLYGIGKHCDELVDDGYGGKEPRFSINTSIANRQEAYKLIGDLASAFRGMAYWASSAVCFTQDSPLDPSMVYTPANVVDGLFTYSGSARKDRPSVALVTWNDPENFFKQTVEYVQDPEMVARYGIRETEQVAFGCTSRGQAHRMGRYLLYTAKYESDLITFKVGLDSALVMPGEVIKIHDTTRAGKRMGGRLAGCTETSARLDAPITIAKAGAVISVCLPDGTFVDRTMIQHDGEFETVTWTTPLTALPEQNSMWIVSEDILEPLLARVVGIAQESTSEFSIQAIEHNPSKYNAIDKDLQLEERKTSIVDFDAVNAPVNLSIVESSYYVAPMSLGVKIHVSWEGKSTVAYQVMYRRTTTDGTVSNWLTGRSDSQDYEILNAQKGTYEVMVWGLSPSGKKSATYITGKYTVVGKTAAPGDVTNFRVIKRTTDLLLSWDSVTDIDLAGYEIRTGGSSWDDSVIMQTRFMGTSIVDDKCDAGEYNYHIRAINTSGIYQDNVSSFKLILERPASVSGFSAVQSGESIVFRWRANAEDDIAGYIIREGRSWASSSLITEIAATTYTMQSGSAVASRTFWIKSVASPGVECELGTYAVVSVVVPDNRNLVLVSNEFEKLWSGTKYGVAKYDDDLVLEQGKTYGEYTFGIELPALYRARNSISSDFDAIAYDSETWSSLNYDWASDRAQRAWVFSVNSAAVDLEYYISKFNGLADSVLERMTLNGTTTGDNGTVASVDVNVNYGEGRFLKGVQTGDFTSVSWDLTIPEVFGLTFWVTPTDLSGERVMWVGKTADGLTLTLTSNSNDKMYHLGDSLGNNVSVPVWGDAGERVLIGITQTETTRTLRVGIFNKSAQHVNMELAPLGALTSISLNQ